MYTPFLFEDLIGKGRLGDLGGKWKDNIEIDAKEMECDWIHLAQDRVQWLALVNMVMNL
jgi:hypothetical protein